MAGVFLNHFPPCFEAGPLTDSEPSACTRLADQRAPWVPLGASQHWDCRCTRPHISLHMGDGDPNLNSQAGRVNTLSTKTSSQAMTVIWKNTMDFFTLERLMLKLRFN